MKKVLKRVLVFVITLVVGAFLFTRISKTKE